MLGKNIIFVLKFKISIMALPLLAAGIGAGLNLYNMYNASQREAEARSEANKLAQIPVPKYTPNSRLLGYYEQSVKDVASPMGYTGAETNRFNSRLAQILNAQKYNAEQLGGGSISRAIGGLNSAQSLNALNDFTANDANLRRTNRNMGLSRMGATINQLQNLDNMNTQVDLNRRLMKEQALGEAIRSNRDLVSNSIGNLGSDLIGFGLTSMLPTGGVKGTNSAAVGVPSDIKNPNIFGGGKMFSGNRFSNYIDAPAAQQNFSFPNTQDMTYNFRTGRYE